jgi:ADP-ribose diphosphatase
MSRTTAYRGKRIELTLQSIPLAAGGTTTKEIVVHPGAAVLIPWLDGNRIVMVRNHRWSINQTLLELPAGTLDPGEAPETTARRELAEETGYQAGRIRKVAEFYPSPGILTELMHLFVAEDLTPGRQHLDAGEKLEPVIMNWNDAVELAVRGEIKDGKTLVGLLLWERRRSAES